MVNAVTALKSKAQALEEMTNTADLLFLCQVADHKTGLVGCAHFCCPGPLVLQNYLDSSKVHML